MSEFLLPCPFCGGPADFEEMPQGSSSNPKSCTWSVGCQNDNLDCIGYQMLANYNRKSEAAEAWNKRMHHVVLDQEHYNNARTIVSEEWQCAVQEFSLRPGSITETVVARIINRIDSSRKL